MQKHETDSLPTQAQNASDSEENFEEGAAFHQPVANATAQGDTLAITLDGYEGPLDMLLVLARTQKVDLKQLSILQLAEQYLDFIAHAQAQAQTLKLELAADYLVMAAWLAYLKSRLLLPPPHDPDAPDPEQMAAHLLFRLQCLEAMREAAAKLMKRNLLGRDFFEHGMPEGIGIKRESVYRADLFELLGAYSTQRLRDYYSSWTPPKIGVLSIERARMRLERMLGTLDDWQPLLEVVTNNMRDTQKRRTTMASSFSAALDYVHNGRMEIQQASNFAPLLVRRARPKKAISEQDKNGINYE